MIQKTYIIYDMVNKKYWAKSHRFRGELIFAKQFSSKDDAVNITKMLCKEGGLYLEIKTIYH